MEVYVCLIVGWLLPTATSMAVLLGPARVVSTTVSPAFQQLFALPARVGTTTMLISLVDLLVWSMDMWLRLLVRICTAISVLGVGCVCSVLPVLLEIAHCAQVLRSCRMDFAVHLVPITVCTLRGDFAIIVM